MTLTTDISNEKKPATQTAPLSITPYGDANAQLDHNEDEEGIPLGYGRRQPRPAAAPPSIPTTYETLEEVRNAIEQKVLEHEEQQKQPEDEAPCRQSRPR